MDFLQSLLLAIHLVGMSMLIGPFIMQMKAKSGFAFPVMALGATLQLLSGLAMYGIEIATEEDVNHAKFGVKILIGVAVLVPALVGYLRQKAIAKQRAGLAAGGAAIVAGPGIADDPKLKPFFHVAGGLAVVNALIAVFWR